MRISQKTEWILVAALIVYIAFTPGLYAVRQFLSTGVGKAVGLAAVVATWKFVSPLVALLLTIVLLRCASMREYMENSTPPPNTYCPTDYKYENGQCKGSTGQSTAPTMCTSGETWDGTKCVSAAAAPPSTPPPMTTPPPSTSSTTTKQPFVNMTPSPVVGGVQPDTKEKFSGGLNFAPV